jgi:hypothetical protein
MSFNYSDLSLSLQRKSVFSEEQPRGKWVCEVISLQQERKFTTIFTAFVPPLVFGKRGNESI